MKKITIGIAAGRKYDNYLNWILEVPHTEVIRLSHEENNLTAMQKCDGLILSGGEDVHPRFYNKPEYVLEYGLDDIDEARDEFEWQVLSHSQQHGLPMLGVCRGLQLANVFFGGTLIPDLPSFMKAPHTKFSEGNDRQHGINVTSGSLLSKITGTIAGEVNSAHHQAVDKPGNGLSVNAVSTDGVIEGLERTTSGKEPYLLLVQWHPERMSDSRNPFSYAVRDSFLSSIQL